MRRRYIFCIFNFLLLNICCIYFFCTGEKNSNNVRPSSFYHDPPTIYKESTLGFSNRIHKKLPDSLLIYSRTRLSKKLPQKIDYLFSMVEIYDKNDSLISRKTNTSADTNQVVISECLYPFPMDTFLVRAWGFGYKIVDDTTYGNRKELLVVTTPLFLRAVSEDVRINSLKCNK